MNHTLNKGITEVPRQEPEWLQQRRQTGLETYQSLNTPSAKDENWRFAAPLSEAIDSFSTSPASELSEEQVNQIQIQSMLVDAPIAEQIFADDHLIYARPLPEDLLESGVCYMSISEAIEKRPDLLEAYFLKESTRLGSEKYFGLHAAKVKAGCLLYVPKGVEIDRPVVNYYWSDGHKQLQCPHTLVIAEAQAKVSIVDVYASTQSDSSGLNLAVSNVYAKPSAHVFRKVVQNLNKQCLSFQLDTAIAERDAQVKNLAINLGAAKARYENQVEINGSGAHVTMDSLTVAEGTQEFDQRSFQTHNAPNSVSDLLYKNALFDTSRTIFSGLIQVAEGAQQTDAYQTNRNLLLDPRADANALPGLEILANDVKCSHGATTGTIDSDELFYMLSRGIPKRVAMQLIVLGFFEEVLEKLDSESLSENIRNLLGAKFSAKMS
ncbi:MAG: Fe-S cluster assembly protein SufD [Puniceicoccaceae bacterium]|nr:MAG: Fe-S cluster assembly protein SufD [Puniceicoccaceae bacterium]